MKNEDEISLNLKSTHNNNGLILIQADMLTQEAAIHQIQEAKTMVEEDLQQKLEEFEEEREHLLKLANTATTMERELEQVSKPVVLNLFYSKALSYSKSILQGPPKMLVIFSCAILLQQREKCLI